MFGSPTLLVCEAADIHAGPKFLAGEPYTSMPRAFLLISATFHAELKNDLSFGFNHIAEKSPIGTLRFHGLEMTIVSLRDNHPALSGAQAVLVDNLRNDKP